MTTGRINQVAAFLTHPPGRSRGGAPVVEQSEPRRSGAGASFNGEVSIAMLRDRLCDARGGTQKAPFPRILSENSSSALQRFGDDQLGATKRLSEWDSRRGGCAASRLMTLKEARLRADTNCSGNGFGGMPAHRVMIQAPQPRLHSGLQEAQRQPSVGRALTRPTAIDTNLRHLDPWLLQPPVSARRNAQSLTSYQAHPIPREEWAGPSLEQALEGSSTRLLQAQSTRKSRTVHSRLLCAASSARPWPHGSWAD